MAGSTGLEPATSGVTGGFAEVQTLLKPYPFGCGNLRGNFWSDSAMAHGRRPYVKLERKCGWSTFTELRSPGTIGSIFGIIHAGTVLGPARYTNSPGSERPARRDHVEAAGLR